ncbi:MAG TPA: hypothetical protein VM680_10125 [Verrucomicrobiae bacterium]|nr:hypothetical protein [Verrucomicrobiae bacterium]
MPAQQITSTPLSSFAREAVKALRYHWPMRATTRLLVATIAFAAFAAAAFICHHNPKAHLEHGPLENVQAIALALGAIFLAAGSTTCSGAARVFVLGVSLFCFIFLMLEFDTRAFNVPLLRKMTNGTPRNLWLGTLATLYAYAFWGKRTEMPTLFQRWLQDRAGLLMLLSGGFWIAGAVFEHGNFFTDTNVTLILEEVLEVDAALFMAWSAFATVKLFSGAGAAASKRAALP